MRIELARIKNRIREGIIEKIGWVNSMDQIADNLTKRGEELEGIKEGLRKLF